MPVVVTVMLAGTVSTGALVSFTVTPKTSRARTCHGIPSPSAAHRGQPDHERAAGGRRPVERNRAAHEVARGHTVGNDRAGGAHGLRRDRRRDGQRRRGVLS